MRIWLDVQIEIHPFILRIRTKCRFEGGGLSEVKSHGGAHRELSSPRQRIRRNLRRFTMSLANIGQE
jgi:hypothetical protein